MSSRTTRSTTTTTSPPKSRQNETRRRRLRHRHHRSNPSSKSAMKSIDITTHPSLSESSSSSESVSFGETVTVRFYATVLGDHPSPKSGPPVSLDWTVVATEELPLRSSAPSGRSRRHLRLSAGTRIRRLQDAGVSYSAMDITMAECRAIRCQRHASSMTAVSDHDDDGDRTSAAATIADDEESVDSPCAPATRRKRSKPTPGTNALRRTQRGGMLAGRRSGRSSSAAFDPSSSRANETFATTTATPTTFRMRKLLLDLHAKPSSSSKVASSRVAPVSPPSTTSAGAGNNKPLFARSLPQRSLRSVVRKSLQRRCTNLGLSRAPPLQ